MGIRTRLLGGGDASIARARRPEALRLQLAAPPLQGLGWLGRPPGPRAPVLYRWLVRLARAALLGVCRLRVEVQGTENLPAGAALAVCALHRSWIDPLVVVHALPLEPRVWFLGSAPTAFDRPWKERLLHRTGGMLPVWRGGHDIDVHVRAARAVITEGAVLALFLEGAVGGAPDEPARARSGSGLLALRTRAPIVPIAICGTEQLYRGKRIAVRILAPVSIEEILDVTATDFPPPGSPAEMRAARAISEAVAARIAASVHDSYPGTVDPPGHARPWGWLTRLFR